MQPERRKRHFYRQLTKIISWITGVSLGTTVFIILGLLIGIAIFVRTDTFQTGLRDRVLQIARTELDASIVFEAAQVNVFSFEPKIHLQKVRFSDEKKKVGVEINRISVGISIFSLPLLAFQQLVLSTAEIEGLHYEIKDTKTLNRWVDVIRPKKSLLPSRFQTSIQRVVLSNVVFEVDLGAADIFQRPVHSQIAIESAQVGLESDQIEISGLMSLKELKIDEWGPYEAQLSLDRANVKGSRINFRKLQLRRDQDSLEFSGGIQNIESPILDIVGSTRVDLSFYFGKQDLRGMLESEFKFKGPWKKLEGEGKAKIINGKWHLKSMDELEAEWRLAQNAFDLKTLEWKDRGESGRGRALIPLSQDQASKLDLEVTKMDLHSYLPLLDEGLRNWQGTASGSLKYDGFLTKDLSGKLSWSLTCSDFQIRAFHSNTSILEIPHFDLRGDVAINPSMTGTMQTTLQAGGSLWSGSAQFTKSDFNMTWTSKSDGAYFGKLFDYQVHFAGDLPGTLKGPWNDLVMSAAPRLKSFQLNKQEITNLRGNLNFSDRTLSAAPLEADQLIASGGIYFSENGPDLFRKMEFSVRNLNFQEIFGFMNVHPKDIFEIDGTILGKGYLTGPILLPNGSGTLQIDQWSIGGKSGRGHKARSNWAASQGTFYADDFEVFVTADQKPLTGDLTADSKGLSSVAIAGRQVRLSDWMFVFGQDVNIQSLANLDLDYQRDVPSLRLNAELTETSFAGIGQENSKIEFNWMKDRAQGVARFFGDNLHIDFKSEQDQARRKSNWNWKLSRVNISPWLPFVEASRLETYCSGDGYVEMLQKRNPANTLLVGLFSDPTEFSGLFSVAEAGIQRTRLVLQRVEPFKIQILRTASGHPRFVADQIKIFSNDRLLNLSGFYENPENFQILAEGGTDLRALSGLNPFLSRSEGLLDINGKMTPSGFSGRADLTGGLLTFQSSNIVVREVDASLRAENSNFELSRLNGNFREGTMTASGRFRLTSKGIEKTKLGIQLDHILLQPENGISLRASGPIDLLKGEGQGEISGKLFINDGLFRRRIDLRSDLVKFFDDERRIFTVKDNGESEWTNWKMNIQLITADPFSVRNNVGEGSINFNLYVRGTANSPHLVGSMDIQRGQFNFNNRQFTIQSGSVQFQNPDSNVPNYDLRAETEIAEYRVSMRLQGGPGSQKIIYSSEPALSEKDIISLISFGIPSSAEELKGQDQTRSVSFSGLSFVTGGLQDKIESRLSQDLGIQRFQLGPAFFEETGRTELQFTVGTDLIRNKVAVNYSNFISASGGHRVELDFKVNRNVSLIGSWRDVREEQGKTGEGTDDFGGDLRFRFEFE